MVPSWHLAVPAAQEGDDQRPQPQPEFRPRRRRSRPWFQRKIFIIPTIVAVVLMALGGTLFAVYQGQAATLKTVEAHMTAAEAQLKIANGQIKSLTPVTPPAEMEKVQATFKAAYDQLEAARKELKADSVLNALAVVPGAREQVAAIYSFIRIGEDAIRGGQSAVAVASQLHVLSVATPGLSPPERVYQLAQKAQPQLDAAVAAIKDAEKSRKTINEKALLPELRAKLPAIDKSLNQAGQLITLYATGMKVLLPALGSTGPKNYLVVFMDTAELRGTGGLIGSFGVLSFNQGKQSPLEMKDVYSILNGIHPNQKLTDPALIPPPPIAQANPGWEWRLIDAAWSPDFPTMAREAEALFKKETGQSVDGVVGVDQVAAQDMLRATGPIPVPGYNVTVTSENLVQQTVKNIELQPKPGQERKTFLSVLAKTELDKITHLDPAAWPDAVKAMQTAIAGRHVQMYVNDPGAESFLGQLSMSSPLITQPHSDMVAVVDNQLGYTKVAILVDRNYSDKVTLQSDGSVQHSLTLSYKNNGKPGDATFGDNFENYLRVFVPKNAKLVNQSGFTKGFSADQTDGALAFEGWAVVPAQKSLTVNITWTVPNAFKPGSSYSLIWRKQAGVISYPLQISATAGGKSLPVGAQPMTVDSDRTFQWKA